MPAANPRPAADALHEKDKFLTGLLVGFLATVLLGGCLIGAMNLAAHNLFFDPGSPVAPEPIRVEVINDRSTHTTAEHHNVLPIEVVGGRRFVPPNARAGVEPFRIDLAPGESAQLTLNWSAKADDRRRDFFLELGLSSLDAGALGPSGPDDSVPFIRFVTGRWTARLRCQIESVPADR